MERIALQKLINWNNNKRKKPLIIWGARQVGKTYLVEELFAKTYYKNNYIYVDCKKEDEIREFCSETANAEKIIEYISLRKGKQINENTLLIFDEVQECPNIISSLKYFCQDFREIPVIATGSMVRIKLQRETKKRGAKENNKFVFSHVKAGKRSAELEDSLQWLSDAGLITQCFMVEKPELPLAGFADRTYFKVYMSDLGLLRVRSGLSAETILGETGMYGLRVRFQRTMYLMSLSQ